MSGDLPHDALEAIAAEMRALREEIKAAKRSNGHGKNGHISVPRWMVQVFAALAISFIIGGIVLAAEVKGIVDTRFTREDGEQMRSWVRDYIRDNVPPPDVLRRLTNHETRLDLLERR